jgi:Protein of unknown function (DUF3237)
MSLNPNEPLPEVLQTIRTRHLFTLRLDVLPILDIGGPPAPYRRIGVVPGGSFQGERLSGDVMDGGSDWQTLRSDGSTTLDVRLVLHTNDDAHILMTYRGVRHGPPDILARLARGEEVDPASYYFRTNPLFESSAPRYDYLNRLVAVAIGHRQPAGPVYNVFEVL